MSDVLSQSEIDELIKALNSGELDVAEVKRESREKKVKVYDFKRPNKFAKDQLRTLEMIHENYARLFSTFLSGYLRSLASVEVVSVEQLTYYEFVNSLSNPTIMAVSRFNPFSGSIIFEVNPSIAFVIIDRVLGGDGKGKFKVRSFTEIELTIMENLIDKLLKLLTEPWKNVADIYPEIEKIETNPQFAQVMSPNETVALITISVKIAKTKGMVNLCIPHLTIEPIIDKLSTRYWFSFSKRVTTEEDLQALEKRLENTVVPLKVVLGGCEILLKEVIDLQVGDVIQLNRGSDQPLEMYVGNKAKFLVKPGVVKKKLAVKVVEVVTKGEEAYE